jgi:two-component system nitrogen regulation response regulator GlnG
MPTLLVVDDEPAIQHAFQRALRGKGIALLSVGTAADAIEQFAEHAPDVVVLDVHLPDASGLETFDRLRKLDARTPIILITGHGTTDLAIAAMKEGAFDYILKPLELAELKSLIDRAIESSRLMRVPAAMPEVEPAETSGDLLIGRCPAMQEVYKAIGRVARQDVTVLILGESGTGKELVARAIYQHSSRADKPFIAINCGAIPDNLVESELFGHERGAFTGADRKRIGRFEQANGGTVFLDEVGEMPVLAQVKMLRLLQEQQFERVGGEELLSTNVRIIAATNADLNKLVEAGRFRTDLYFRLNVFAVQLPPLRERGEDLILLIEHFVRKFSNHFSRAVPSIDRATVAALRNYHWPGNVRELQSVLKQALLNARGAALLPDDLPTSLQQVPADAVISSDVFRTATNSNQAVDWSRYVEERIDSHSDNLYAEALERMEREVLMRVLKHTGGNQLQAAKILGITRGSLRTKIRALHISIDREIWSPDDQSDS